MAESTILEFQPEYELVWENPDYSSSSGFAAQTISLDLSGYTFVKVEAHLSEADHTRGESPIIPIHDGPVSSNVKFLTCMSSNIYNTESTGNPYAYTRAIYASETGVTFGAAYRRNMSSTSAGTTNTNWVIPTRIWAF